MAATIQDNDEWGMKLGEKEDFGRSTTLKPKVLEPGTQVPTRGPVVSEGKLFCITRTKKIFKQFCTQFR